jgi:hypothetical protein
MARVRLDKPEMRALLASLRTHGWRKAVTIAVYRDGERFCVSEGRRRITCLRIENERRKAERDPRGPIRPRVVLDDDPSLTTVMANEMREGDPPMVRARRFVELRETMGAEKAAAAIGETLQNANALALILAAPNRDLHAAVNDMSIPVDVALRATKGGSEAVAKVLAKSKGDGGKVDPKVAKAAAREAVPDRPRARPARIARPIADELERLAANKTTCPITGERAVPPHVVALAKWFAGNDKALDGFPTLAKAIDSAKAVSQ